MIRDDLGFWAAGHVGLVEEASDCRLDRRDRSAAWQARLLRVYLASKLGLPTPSAGSITADSDLFSDLEPALVAAVNGARFSDREEIERLVAQEGTARSKSIDRLRARGLELIAACPVLRLDRLDAGPPRELDLPALVDEAEREALVDEVLAGRIDLSTLSHHVLTDVLARLGRRKKAAENAELERRRLHGAPTSRGDIYDLADFYESREWQIFLTAISAVQAAIQAMAASTWRLD